MDTILFWNGVAPEANRVSHTSGRGEQTGPTLSSRALAIFIWPCTTPAPACLAIVRRAFAAPSHASPVTEIRFAKVRLAGSV